MGQREHMWELRLECLPGDAVVGVAEGALVGVSVFFVVRVADAAFGVAEGASVGAEVGLYNVIAGRGDPDVGVADGMFVGFLLWMEVGACVVTTTEDVVFQFTPVAFKLVMLQSNVSFANVSFSDVANAIAVLFFRIFTKLPFPRVSFVTFLTISSSIVVAV